MTAPNQPYPDYTDVLGVGAYRIGNAESNYGQSLTEQAINSIAKPPDIDFANPMSTLQQYLARLPLDVLKTFAHLLPEDLQDNFENVIGAVSAITGVLQPALQSSFWNLLMEFGKFLIGQATWEDVEDRWADITGTIEDLNIAAGAFWGGVISILVSPWVSEEFADKLSDLIVVYFQRTQGRATQQDLEDALDLVLAEDPESDFWKFVLGSLRFSSRASNLVTLFFEVLSGDEDQSVLTAAFHDFLDMFGIPPPDLGWLDFGLSILPKWVKDLEGFLSAGWNLLVALWNYVLGSGAFGPARSDALKDAWNDFYVFFRPEGVGTALATTDNFWGTVASNALASKFPLLVGGQIPNATAPPIFSDLLNSLFGTNAVESTIDLSAIPDGIYQSKIEGLEDDLDSAIIGSGISVGRTNTSSVNIPVGTTGTFGMSPGFFNASPTWKTDDVSFGSLKIGGTSYTAVQVQRAGLYICELSFDTNADQGGRFGVGFAVGGYSNVFTSTIMSGNTFTPIYRIQGAIAVYVPASGFILPVFHVVSNANIAGITFKGESTGLVTRFSVTRAGGPRV